MPELGREDPTQFNNSELKECILNGTIGWPPPDKLPNDEKVTPYFILEDDIFALRTCISYDFLFD